VGQMREGNYFDYPSAISRANSARDKAVGPLADAPQGGTPTVR